MKKYVWWLIVLGALGIGLMMSGIRQDSASAANTNRVGLVIAYGDGTVTNQCISYSKEKITGLEVLQASGLPLEVAYDSVGAAVCKIGNEGCPADNCFCDSPPNFWAYWHLKDGNWVFSQLGAGIYHVSDGDVEGWIWGPGQSNPPQEASFDQICAEQPTDTQEPTITLTEIPTITPTEIPAITPTKTPTRTPKPTRTPTPTTDESVPIQALDQPTNTSEPARELEQPTESSVVSAAAQPVYLPLVLKMEAPPEDTPLPTAIAASSTPAAIAQAHKVRPTRTSSAEKDVTPQTGEGDSVAVSGLDSGWGSYLFLGVIVAGLGIGLYGVTHKKWK